MPSADPIDVASALIPKEMVNAGSPEASYISCISPEVLVEIFLARLMASPSEWMKQTLTLMLVSKYWEQVVLDTPEIWATIHSCDPIFIQRSIARARSIPLTIRAEHLLPNQDEPLATILASLSQMRSLTLYPIRRREVVQGFDKEWTSPAQDLEELVTTRIVLPRGLLGGFAPSLRKFSVNHGSSDWTTFPDCPQLEELEILAPFAEISVTTLVQILQRSPHLKKLAIKRALEDSNPLTERVELCKLKEISLAVDRANRTDRIVKLLNHISIPADAGIQIMVDIYEEQDVYIDVVEAVQRCRSGRPLSPKSLSVLCKVDDHWVSDFALKIPREGGSNGEPYEIFFSSIEEPSPRTIGVLERLSLGRLESLDLNATDAGYESYAELPLSLWAMVAALPCLQSLSVRNLYALSFLIDGTEDVFCRESAGETNKPFRSLLRLEYEESNKDAAHQAGDLADRLKTMTSLTQLTFISASSEGEWSDILRSVVRTVEVRTQMVELRTDSESENSQESDEYL
ncbi:hypothetical protein BDN72DRAFT_846869 [Pluteus cervinus]|uniref:Uncharacterized protein n=1 Tax=Pluteus cervinus TaxID=181527 RepID=A0ACD3AEQ6_9AGAR|nr:hypothetical protein BDN72DRAFT_846869 [Pluteus cervinus]